MFSKKIASWGIKFDVNEPNLDDEKEEEKEYHATFNNATSESCFLKRNHACNRIVDSSFSCTVTNRRYSVINPSKNPLNCSSTNIVYLISCSRCGVQYVGETSLKLHERMNAHRYCIRKKKEILLYEHFNNGSCDISHLRIQPIEQISDEGDSKSNRLKREAFWIKELRTLTPYGLNDKLDSHNWRLRSRDDIAGLCLNTLSTTRGSRGCKKAKRVVRHWNKTLMIS